MNEPLRRVMTSAEHSTADRDRLRRALVWWGNDIPDNHGETSHGDDMRDAVVALIERYGDDRDHAADEIMSLIGRSYDVVDQTLHDLIPEGQWGIVLPDDPTVTVTDFVDGAYPKYDARCGECGGHLTRSVCDDCGTRHDGRYPKKSAASEDE